MYARLATLSLYRMLTARIEISQTDSEATLRGGEYYNKENRQKLLL